MYGGLVNLNNLGGASHTSNNGLGTFGGAPNQQKKGDSFSGLMSGQWWPTQ